MTFWDWCFVVLATVQFSFVAWLCWILTTVLGTMKKGQRKVQPALNRARSLQQVGMAMATHARDDGQAMVTRVRAVTAKVQARVETTKRIFGELKPRGQETAAAADETRQEVVRRLGVLQDLGRRVSRLQRATEAAARAARVDQ
jgi:hypothetical protein